MQNILTEIMQSSFFHIKKSAFALLTGILLYKRALTIYLEGNQVGLNAA